MKKFTWAVDMDCTTYNLTKHVVDIYNRQHGTKYVEQDIKDYGWKDLPNVTKDYINDLLLTPGIFLDGDAIDNAVNVLYKWHIQGDRILFVTAPQYNMFCVYEKYNWLNKFFPFVSDKDIVFTWDKSIIKADFIIDDNPEYLDQFDGIKIAFAQPWNEGYDRAYFRGNWKQIDEFRTNFKYNSLQK